MSIPIPEYIRAIAPYKPGKPLDELAREYGLTEMRVRQIVDTWQRECFARRQGRLPGLDGPENS